MNNERMNIVIVGHVDHGKSTVIGRLLADTGVLPEGKLEQIQERCKRESKEFEYAFLLDALKDEQSQGITIDSARCFFKSKKREYLIIDAPGHIEFLKNMISGAARAEAAVLVIDAAEGVQENSRRHGYMLSLLGIKQVVVCVNKMDLVNYDEQTFNKIKAEYMEFLQKIGIEPRAFIPVSALKGDNIAGLSPNLSWFTGHNVLSALDAFEKENLPADKPFRMPVQDVYRFTSKGDNRRIIAGRIESGTINVGDSVVFLPSNKRSRIQSIELFNGEERTKELAGSSAGFTLTEQVYVNRGDVMCKETEQLPHVSSTIRANIFWMGKQPMEQNKEYKLKLATIEAPVKLKEIITVLDASNLNNATKQTIDRHEVAECILESQSAVAFDLSRHIEATGRFVIVDNYDIAGGGIIPEFIEDSQSSIRQQVFLREEKWDHGLVHFSERISRYSQVPKLLFITGTTGIDKKTIAKGLELKLFESGKKVYFLGIGNLLRGLDADIEKEKRLEHIRRLAEVSHILMDAGIIVVATASDLTEEELKIIRTITGKDNVVMIDVGEQSSTGPYQLHLMPHDSVEKNVTKIIDLLKFKNFIFSR